ncbi:DEAD/DEAH box helicase family protein [Streptomyces diastaticus]|nr:DEAD/DEAH box helicase family protein [Streptomyces diastaticus]
MNDAVVAPGQLVKVRGEHWVVARVDESRQPVDELAAARLPGRTLVTLTNVSGDDVGDSLTVVWEMEPGRQLVSSEELPEVQDGRWDDPQRLGAFLDAARWGSVASADTETLQAPFRSGITVYPHQLAPVAKALSMPRVNLLVADDVGLGKTIEAGLVIQEMLLRHRARRVLVVCPASLTGKWQEEMKQRFGLDFTVLSSMTLRDLRRTHGLGQNPFSVFPRLIISLQWLRSPIVRRLLDEVLTEETRHPGFFDLLVVDEVHHCAPPAPQRGKGYAVDSKQTEAVKRVSEHSQHRVFLSATPHNGYSNSWQALLAMLDPQRFTRGMTPTESALEEVMVRRLKDQIKDDEDNGLFQPRTNRAIPVTYSPAEIQVQQLLEAYRTERLGESATAVKANDLVTLMLKRRLFSSPAAFTLTLRSHATAAEGYGQATPPGDDDLAWLDEAADWDQETEDDEPGSVGELELLTRIANSTGPLGGNSRTTLEELLAWADVHGQKTDSKAEALVAEIQRVLTADPSDRVIVFTEFRDTQTYLADILNARGLGGEKLELLYGGMDPKRRDAVKLAFQAAPHRTPVRILLATDSASEGIDLQNYCHRIINYDIPFNPNRLEQRIGRVDRHGQRFPVDVAHFVGTDWENAEAKSFKGDLEFLSRVAVKVATERADLGSINPVLAAAVEAQLLGRPMLVDPLEVKQKPSASMLKAEQDVRAHTQRLRKQLSLSERRLHVSPVNVRRVVDVGLAMAEQQPLVDLSGGQVEVPDLKRGWERTVTGLEDPLDHVRRPVVFDGTLLEGRDDSAVHAHLEHPLVSQCARLLRSAMWQGHSKLHRVSAVTVTLPEDCGITDVLAVAYARLVVVGADGRRLHEEIMPVARAVPASGRSRAVDLGQLRKNPREDDIKARLRRALEDGFAPDACREAPAAALALVTEAWPTLAERFAKDVREAARARLTDLETALTDRQVKEVERVNATLSQLEESLQRLLAEPSRAFVQLSLDELQQVEQDQIERDVEAIRARLDSLPGERRRDVAEVERRYAGLRELVFPFAVAVCVPEGWEEN